MGLYKVEIGDREDEHVGITAIGSGKPQEEANVSIGEGKRLAMLKRWRLTSPGRAELRQRSGTAEFPLWA